MGVTLGAAQWSIFRRHKIQVSNGWVAASAVALTIAFLLVSIVFEAGFPIRNSSWLNSYIVQQSLLASALVSVQLLICLCFKLDWGKFVLPSTLWVLLFAVVWSGYEATMFDSTYQNLKNLHQKALKRTGPSYESLLGQWDNLIDATVNTQARFQTPQMRRYAVETLDQAQVDRQLLAQEADEYKRLLDNQVDEHSTVVSITREIGSIDQFFQRYPEALEKNNLGEKLRQLESLRNRVFNREYDIAKLSVREQIRRRAIELAGSAHRWSTIENWTLAGDSESPEVGKGVICNVTCKYIIWMRGSIWGWNHFQLTIEVTGTVVGDVNSGFTHRIANSEIMADIRTTNS